MIWQEVDFSQTPALAIYTQVQQDYQPVLNADVTAIISDDSSSTTTMTLLDNGSGETSYLVSRYCAINMINKSTHLTHHIEPTFQSYINALWNSFWTMWVQAGN